MSIVRPAIEALEDSPILEIFRRGVGREGLIALWAGEPDLPTPAFICDAASRALAAGRTFYSHNRGLPELRALLAAYHRRLYGAEIADDRIAFTYSGMNAVMLVMQATLGAGDNAVLISPAWPNAGRAARIVGAEVREVPLRRDRSGWRLELEDVVAALDRRTRLVYLASPGNPTGWTIELGQARALLDVCRERGIALLSDEVYHRIVYDRPDGRAWSPSLLEVARDPSDPLFVVQSFSKSWAMTGWRMGWVLFPSGLAPVFEKLIQFNTSGGLEFMQAGAIAALTEGEPFVADLVARCARGRAIALERLGAMPRVTTLPADAAFYAMFEVEGVSDVMRFCRDAVDQANLGLAPGTSFGPGAERLVRICYAKSPALLETAMDRLAEFVASYRAPD